MRNEKWTSTATNGPKKTPETENILTFLLLKYSPTKMAYEHYLQHSEQ